MYPYYSYYPIPSQNSQHLNINQIDYWQYYQNYLVPSWYIRQGFFQTIFDIFQINKNHFKENQKDSFKLLYQMNNLQPQNIPYQVGFQSVQQLDFNNNYSNNYQLHSNNNINDVQGLDRLMTQNNIEKTDLLDDLNLKKKVKKQRGHWTNEEHYKFLQFVRLHSDLFKTTVHKKLNRVFKMMAEEIQTRNACQCRSHFSKFNPFIETNILRRKLCNNEQVYERMFENNNKLDVQ